MLSSREGEGGGGGETGSILASAEYHQITGLTYGIRVNRRASPFLPRPRFISTAEWQVPAYRLVFNIPKQMVKKKRNFFAHRFGDDPRVISEAAEERVSCRIATSSPPGWQTSIRTRSRLKRKHVTALSLVVALVTASLKCSSKEAALFFFPTAQSWPTIVAPPSRLLT